MGRTTINVSSVVIEDILFEGAVGEINIIDAKLNSGTGIIKFIIEGVTVPDCPQSDVIITITLCYDHIATQCYRTVEIKPR